jgi:hypothetical protein
MQYKVGITLQFGFHQGWKTVLFRFPSASDEFTSYQEGKGNEPSIGNKIKIDYLPSILGRLFYYVM